MNTTALICIALFFAFCGGCWLIARWQLRKLERDLKSMEGGQ